MLARRLPTILPDLTFDESLEITKIHSIAGELNKENPIIIQRPFRTPHHTITQTALIGGGRIPKPGEISLAHYGVLFLDELPEFNRNTLEVLREPIEDEKITISRLNSTITYPSKFMLIASMNPCPCGYYGSDIKECVCSKQEISKYMNKISGPLLDRIDIQIQVPSVKYQKLQSITSNNLESKLIISKNSQCKNENENSENIRKRVNKARLIQLKRYTDESIFSNSELTPKLIEKYCKLEDSSKKILELAFNKLGFTARAYVRILKVARTIADLDGSENIETKHLSEAIQYRSLDKKQK